MNKLLGIIDQSNVREVMDNNSPDNGDYFYVKVGIAPTVYQRYSLGRTGGGHGSVISKEEFKQGVDAWNVQKLFENMDTNDEFEREWDV